MLRPLLLIALFALATFPPAVSAAEVRFESPPLHVGDRLLYRVNVQQTLETPPGEQYAWDPAGEEIFEGDHMLFLDVEGPTTTLDQWGMPKQADAILLVRQQGNTVLEALRCYVTDRATLRRDYVEGGFTRSETWDMYGGTLPGVLGNQVRYTNTTPLTMFGNFPCGFDTQGGMTYTSGIDRYGGPVIDAPEGFPEFSGANAPARIDVGEFHGRTALTFVHPLTNERLGERSDSRYGIGKPHVTGELSITVADGFPGAVRIKIHEEQTFFEERRVVDGEMELVGSESGTEPLRSRLPEDAFAARNPNATFADLETLGVPDEALQLPYPFAEAMAALVADPRLGLDRWLAAHPDAGIEQVLYDRQMERGNGLDGTFDRTDTDGGWYVSLSDGAAGFSAVSTRHTAITGPAGALALPAKVVTNTGGEQASDRAPVPRYEALGPAGVASLLAVASIPADTIASVFYAGSEFEGQAFAQLTVSQVPIWSPPSGGAEEGLVLQIDVVRGAATSISTTAQTVASSGFMETLAPPGEVAARAPGSGLSPLSTMGFSALDAAVVAITGAALLAFFVKALLLPLFTRLRRDRLLDNPVRARLYDRIRAEPGIHLAELEEFLGIGKGATKHHVDQLVSHKLAFILEDAGYSRCYASGHVPMEVARRLAVLRAGSHARVYELYAARPALSLRDAARELGMSAPSVHRAKKRLEKEGLLPAAPEVAARIAGT